MIFKRPTVLYPTLVRGYISGPIRCESLDGSEFYLDPKPGKLFIPPFTLDGKMYAVSHLQKRSIKGWLLMSPFCFHYWKFEILQRQDSKGAWIPGTEKGIYARTPGWRWDVAGTNGEHWILTKGYLVTVPSRQVVSS